MYNPWHGCHRISPGCRNCYVYARDAQCGRDASIVAKTASFDLPIRKKRDGSYKLPSGELFTCGTSDFFVEEADGWRPEVWEYIRIRQDIRFMIITKRIHRFLDCLPPGWGEGWPNVLIGCTCENQACADTRLPLFLKAPIRHKFIAAEPLLEAINFRPYLQSGEIFQIAAGGESGYQARPCDFRWIQDIHQQCIEANVDFLFHQTGARLIKDGKLYCIRRRYQHSQARKAGLNFHARKQ